MPEEGQDSRRRVPSVFRRVSGIKPEDIRISLIGTVIDTADDGIVLDDGIGKVDISLPEPPAVKVRSIVRVFGRVIPMEGGIQLQGEIVQDMTGLDMELLKKVESINA